MISNIVDGIQCVNSQKDQKGIIFDCV